MVELVRVSGWHDILVRLLEQGQPFATACANAQVPATRVFNEQGLNPEFKKRCERAMQAGRRNSSGSAGGNGGKISGVDVAAKD